MNQLHVSDCVVESVGPAGTGLVEIAGNPGFTSLTTTQAITASAAPQVVTVSATPAGLVVGQTCSIDSAGNQETFQVQALSAGVSLTAIFTKNHTITQTISLDSSVAGKGMANIFVERLHSVPAVGVNCSGVHIDVATDVRLYGNDLRQTGTSGHANVYLTNGGAYTEARSNLGVNPVGVLGPPAVPATTVAYTNAYGVDAQVFVAPNGATISSIKVDGVTTGVLAGLVLVPAGSTVTLAYTVATPTWVWYGL
jgi:hypothetical protein